jgi:hypothetical protein
MRKVEGLLVAEVEFDSPRASKRFDKAGGWDVRSPTIPPT